MITTASTRNDVDSFDVSYREPGEDRVRFEVSSRRQHLTDVRHRRRGKSATSKKGVHRRRNKRNGL